MGHWAANGIGQEVLSAENNRESRFQVPKAPENWSGEKVCQPAQRGSRAGGARSQARSLQAPSPSFCPPRVLLGSWRKAVPPGGKKVTGTEQKRVGGGCIGGNYRGL